VGLSAGIISLRPMMMAGGMMMMIIGLLMMEIS
jgi:hypothetical protein